MRCHHSLILALDQSQLSRLVRTINYKENYVIWSNFLANCNGNIPYETALGIETYGLNLTLKKRLGHSTPIMLG